MKPNAIEFLMSDSGKYIVMLVCAVVAVLFFFNYFGVNPKKCFRDTGVIPEHLKKDKKQATSTLS